MGADVAPKQVRVSCFHRGSARRTRPCHPKAILRRVLLSSAVVLQHETQRAQVQYHWERLVGQCEEDDEEAVRRPGGSGGVIEEGWTCSTDREATSMAEGYGWPPVEAPSSHR